MSAPSSSGGAGRKPSILALAAVTGLAPVSINIIVPSVPQIADYFYVGYATAQLAVTVFVIAMAVGQLVLGTLSDAFGRRSVLLGGLVVYVAGSALCALAPTMGVLIAGRFIEAAGGVAGVVLGRAMIRDVHGREKSASAIGYVTMVMVVAPMMAPALGGVLTEYVTWRATFWLLVAIGLALILVTRVGLPETRVTGRQPARFSTLVGSFATLLGIRAFVGLTLTMSFSSCMFFTFLGAAPYVAIELLGNSPKVYGLAFISISIAFMLGNFTAARLALRFGTFKLILAGCIGAALGVCAVGISVYSGDLTLATLFGPMMIVTFSNGLAMPNTVASVVSVRPELAGAASGLSGAIQFALAALATYLVAFFMEGSAKPMVWQLAFCAAVATIGIFYATRGRFGDTGGRGDGAPPV